MKKIQRLVTGFLVAIKVVKSNGKYQSGDYITAGVYWWNPISYPIVLIISLIMFFQAGISAFIQCWVEVWAS